MKGAFLVRLIIATSLYAIMGRASVWFDPISNAILVFGSRFFLVLSPFFFSRLKQHAIPASTLLAALGTFFLLLPGNAWLMIGAVCIAIGVSVSGYLIRAYASENIEAAARNKIAINSGIFLSGLVLSLPDLGTTGIALGSFFLLALAAYLARFVVSSRTSVDLPTGSSASRPVQLAWALLGLTMGIKLYAPFTLLPQYIVAHTGSLKPWYGVVVIASSLFIVVLQKLVVRTIGRFTNQKSAKIATWFAMLCGLCVIALPDTFEVATLPGALLWVLILSLVECVASYLDVFGAKDNCLFIKELAVGVGGGLCALVSRYTPPDVAGPGLACVGFVFLAAAVVLIQSPDCASIPKLRRPDAD